MKLQSYFKIALVAIPVLMISWQLYVSNFETLTPWKGGGYGMYTDSHRSVGYITLKNKHREQHVYPLNEESYNNLDSIKKIDYDKDKKIALEFTFYPSKYFKEYQNSSYLKSLMIEGDTLFLKSVEINIESKDINLSTVFQHEL